MNKLKFDRERFDAGEMPTRTRDGTKVLQVFDSGLNVPRPIVAWLEGKDWAYFFQADGRIYSDDRTSGCDLVHGPKMRKVRVAVFWADGHVRSYTDCGNRLFDDYMDLLTREDRLIEVLEIEVPE